MARHWFEFHISRHVRDDVGFEDALFASAGGNSASGTGNVVFANLKAVRALADKLNAYVNAAKHPEKAVKAGSLNAMGIIDEIFHLCCGLYRKQKKGDSFAFLLEILEKNLGRDAVDTLLRDFTKEFPPVSVYRGLITADDYLSRSDLDGATNTMRSNRETTLEEMILLMQANENPAFGPFFFLYSDESLAKNPAYKKAEEVVKAVFAELPIFGPKDHDLWNFLKEPVVASPTSLRGQLDYILTYWADLLGDLLKRLLAGLDAMSEEEKPGWQHFDGPPDMEPYDYNSLMKEYERFTEDRDWMPKVVLLAKTVLVWLTQLSRKYGRDIHTLDAIPDEELDTIARSGFTGLWLIGLWERSYASRRIKQICGNPEAAASAYSLYDYAIAGNLGGQGAMENLRFRLWKRGVRLAADMVPNHTGLDSKWMLEKPQLFLQTGDCPVPGYSYDNEDLCQDSRMNIHLDSKYYNKTDCAVVFKRVDCATGRTTYVYHGNDGTGMPWNDTAQIDFLNPEAREEVIQKILEVARNFPIIRFDAAMVLAKKHIRRLWYPEPGHGGDIPTRSEHAMSGHEFEQRIPEEFWREVVDRCAQEVPDTLLLAEAFWMMEGYFVRTLGMHRVYNSAFMNMLKKEDNQKYRETIKNTLEFDPQVLKRFVNFMNNPDEEPAIVQFGNGDKYFGVATMMVTMPGLPMFGHGQIEGFSEKYGMEYTRDYKNETADPGLVSRHEREIFPLMKKRYLFAMVENFALYDVVDNGKVQENVFAYSNAVGEERGFVFYNNVYQSASGWITHSLQSMVKDSGGAKHLTNRSVAEALNLKGFQDEFCIFREQRSSLWFIRSGRDICDHGLFVSLRGYECQVLLDFKNVYDSADGTGKWAVLCAELNGRGVPDIDQALWDVFLKDLYAAFDASVTESFFTAVLDSVSPVKLKGVPGRKKPGYKAPKIPKYPPLKKVLAANKDATLKFFETLGVFLTGNYGAHAILRPRAAPGRKRQGNTWIPAAWRLFVKRMQTMETLVTEDEFSKLRKSIGDPRQTAAIFASLAVLASFGDAVPPGSTKAGVLRLLTTWRFDKRMAGLLALRGYGDFPSLHRKLLVLSTVLPAIEEKSKKAKTPPRPSTLAMALADALSDSPTAYCTLGVNLFEGVTWFHEEKTAEAFTLATAALALFPEAAMEKMVLAAKVHRKLKDAQKKAAYKLDSLLPALQDKRKKKGSKA